LVASGAADHIVFGLAPFDAEDGKLNFFCGDELLHLDGLFFFEAFYVHVDGGEPGFCEVVGFVGSNQAFTFREGNEVILDRNVFGRLQAFGIWCAGLEFGDVAKAAGFSE
jgi:hypothetical protein